MTEIKIGGAQSYILPLQSIDLTYLSKHIRKPNKEKIPLWSKKYLDGESEYYEVKIITYDINEDCYSEQSDTYKCHICNVHVPITCSNEHNKSKKHETFKNIFDQVLERVSKQINSITINYDKHINKDEYYCVPCSKIIKIENKYKHESSNHHIKSQEDINVVNEFYKIFKENDDRKFANDDLAEESDFDSDYAYKGNNCKKASCTLDSDDDSLSTLSNHLMPELIIDTEKIETKKQPINDVKSIKEKESFEEYLKEMIKKYNLKVNLPVIAGDNVFVMAPNGNKVKVSREHFQSYRQLKGTIYCQMCKMWISQDTKPHEITENHVRHIFKPINEKFARTIDTVSSHCIPCNEVVLTTSNHDTINDNHKKIIKDTITPITKNNDVPKKTLCDVCNIYIDTHNFTAHTYSKKHLNALMQQNSIDKVHNNDFFCKVCEVAVTKQSLKSHINSNIHKIKKNNDCSGSNNATNKLTEINDKINDSGYCEVCKVKVPKGGMEIHIAGKPHIKQINLLLCTDIKNYTKPNENKLKNYTKPSSVTQNASSNNSTTIENTASTTTSSTSSQFGNETNSCNDDKIWSDLLVFTNDTKTSVKCTICEVNIVFVERNIIEHMKGRLHTENVNKQKQKMDIYLKCLSYSDDAETKVKCRICDVNVPYIERNIIEHMEGRNHEDVQNKLLSFHSFTRESTGYVCGCCKIRTTDYLDHINSRTHTIQYQVNHDISKNEIRKYVYEDDINDSVARLNRHRYTNLLKHNNITKVNDSSYYCALCHIQLGRISEIDHVLGERHRLKLEELNLL